MTSAVDICNNALSSIGTRSTISSLDEDSPEARACAFQYPTALGTLLRAAPWNFARKFITLSLLKALPGTIENPTEPVDSLWHESYPPPGWFYSYAYPSDAIMVRYVLPQIMSMTSTGVPIFSSGNYSPPTINPGPVRFAVTTDQDDAGNQVKVVCTNASQAIACYTYACDNPDLWDASFIGAMQDAVAGAITITLTGKIQLARGMLGKANESIMAARANDGNEGLTIYDTVPDWIRIRGYNYYDGLSPGLSIPWGPLFSLPAV
jgi:hypothetical protein